jgi:hypothetical protein
LLSVVLLPLCQAAETEQGILCMKVVPQEMDPSNVCLFYFDRELGRQVVLMAARDMGCLTRDEALLEPLAPLPVGKSITLEPTVFGDFATKKMWIDIKGPNNTQKKFEATYAEQLNERIRAWEAVSRTTVRAALKEWGLPGSVEHPTLKSDTVAPIPPDVQAISENFHHSLSSPLYENFMR